MATGCCLPANYDVRSNEWRKKVRRVISILLNWLAAFPIILVFRLQHIGPVIRYVRLAFRHIHMLPSSDVVTKSPITEVGDSLATGGLL